MIKGYKNISIIYGRSGRDYASHLHQKIETMASEFRYPLRSRIVMESILTQDILSAVTSLFRETEICIAFLTADDYCIEGEEKKYRLRQNVVMELGMALFHLGREKCILLSDFDPHDPNIELPSDINGVEIKFFDAPSCETVFDDVLQKILTLSKTIEGEIPQYNNLLTRSGYLIDYENLFTEQGKNMVPMGGSYLNQVLQFWSEECASLPHYDEKVIYFLERIGFLPIFGKEKEVSRWYDSMEKILSRYSAADVSECGSAKLLNALYNLVSIVIQYTKIKSDPAREPVEEDYRWLCEEFEIVDLPEIERLNPLIGTIYYDYKGLTYMRLYGFSGDLSDLQETLQCFVETEQYVDRVDMGLSIWKGFLYYNLGRAYERMYERTKDESMLQTSLSAMKKGVLLRKRWLAANCFTDHVKYALSYEYFVAKIEQIKMFSKHQLKSPESIREEYQRVTGELDSYCNREEKLEGLMVIRKRLSQVGEELKI